MCPDRQTLSALVDGEVPSPWNEKLLRHVESCAECSRAVRDFRSLSEKLGRAGPADAEAARGAVWARLEDASRIRRPEPLWRARFSIPLPVAAAALLTFAVLSTLVISSRRENTALRLAISAVSEVNPALSHGASLESVLQFLEAQDAKVSVTVQLPPGAGLEAYGKPVFMKAPNLAPVFGEGGR